MMLNRTDLKFCWKTIDLFQFFTVPQVKINFCCIFKLHSLQILHQYRKVFLLLFIFIISYSQNRKFQNYHNRSSNPCVVPISSFQWIKNTATEILVLSFIENIILMNNINFFTSYFTKARISIISWCNLEWKREPGYSQNLPMCCVGYTRLPLKETPFKQA